MQKPNGEFITEFYGAVKDISEKSYEPLLVKHALKKTDFGYALTKKKATASVVVCGEGKLKFPTAIVLANKTKKHDIYILGEKETVLPNLPTLVIEFTKGNGVYCSAGTKISGGVLVRVDASEGDNSAVADGIVALESNNLKVKVKEGNPLFIEAYYFEQTDLERFTMALARLTASKQYRVTVERAVEPIAGSNRLLASILPILGKKEEYPTEFCFKPYHEVAKNENAVVRISGDGEDKIEIITKLIDALTEEK